MKAKLLSAILSITLLGLCQASATTYSVAYPWNVASTPPVGGSPGALTLSGTITTDGNTGILSQADIVGWDLTISGYGSPFVLDPSNSFVTLWGGDLMATPSVLEFDFSNAGPFSPDGPFSSGPYALLEFSNANGSMDYANEATSNAAMGLAVPGLAELIDQQCSVYYGCGPQTVATVTATPLPDTLPLFVAGIGGLGWLGWRTKRNNTSALAVA